MQLIEVGHPHAHVELEVVMSWLGTDFKVKDISSAIITPSLSHHAKGFTQKHGSAEKFSIFFMWHHTITLAEILQSSMEMTLMQWNSR